MAFLKKYMWYIVAAVLLYIVYRVISNRITGPKSAAPVVGAGGSVSVPGFKYDASKVNRDKTFGMGTNNSNEVAYLQTWLNAYFNKGLKVDGDFGARTSAAMISVLPGSNPISTTLNMLKI